MKHIFLIPIVAASTAAFLNGQENMWKCTLEYKKESTVLTAQESERLKALLDPYEKKAAGTTDEEETVFHPPMAIFQFAKNGSETIQYLSFHHEEPFTIEVATGNRKTRRVIHGDKQLLMKITEIIGKAFPKK